MSKVKNGGRSKQVKKYSAASSSKGLLSQSQSKIRKTRFAFSIARDITLLKSVLQHTPWVDDFGEVLNELRGYGWDVTERTVKKRFFYLAEKFKKEEMADMNRSGTEVEYDERANLLSNIVGLWEAERILITNGPESDDDSILSDNSMVFQESDVLTLSNERSNTELLPSASQPDEVSQEKIVSQPLNKKARRQEKKLADAERDKARDTALANGHPVRNASKKQSYADFVEQKMRFDMDMKEKEMELKKSCQDQNFTICQRELDLEEKRLALVSESNTNQAMMLKLMEAVFNK